MLTGIRVSNGIKKGGSTDTITTTNDILSRSKDNNEPLSIKKKTDEY